MVANSDASGLDAAAGDVDEFRRRPVSRCRRGVAVAEAEIGLQRVDRGLDLLCDGAGLGRSRALELLDRFLWRGQNAGGRDTCEGNDRCHDDYSFHAFCLLSGRKSPVI